MINSKHRCSFRWISTKVKYREKSNVKKDKCVLSRERYYIKTILTEVWGRLWSTEAVPVCSSSIVRSKASRQGLGGLFSMTSDITDEGSRLCVAKQKESVKFLSSRPLWFADDEWTCTAPGKKWKNVVSNTMEMIVYLYYTSLLHFRKNAMT